MCLEDFLKGFLTGRGWGGEGGGHKGLNWEKGLLGPICGVGGNYDIRGCSILPNRQFGKNLERK